jgi:hypothetical protein
MKLPSPTTWHTRLGLSLSLRSWSASAILTHSLAPLLHPMPIPLQLIQLPGRLGCSWSKEVLSSCDCFDNKGGRIRQQFPYKCADAMLIQRFLVAQTGSGGNVAQTMPVALGAGNFASRILGTLKCCCELDIILEMVYQLHKRSKTVCSPAATSREERNWDLLVQWVAINVIDSGIFGRRIARWDPGDIAVKQKHHIGIFGAFVSAESEAFGSHV